MPRPTTLILLLLLLATSNAAMSQTLGAVDLGGIIVTPTVNGDGTITFGITTISGRRLLGPDIRVEGRIVFVIVSSVDVPLSAPGATYSMTIGPLPPGSYTISYHNVTAPFHQSPSVENRISFQTAQVSDPSVALSIPSSSAYSIFLLSVILTVLGLRATRRSHA